jgi:hypothetical protein
MSAAVECCSHVARTTTRRQGPCPELSHPCSLHVQLATASPALLQPTRVRPTQSHCVSCTSAHRPPRVPLRSPIKRDTCMPHHRPQKPYGKPSPPHASPVFAAPPMMTLLTVCPGLCTGPRDSTWQEGAREANPATPGSPERYRTEVALPPDPLFQ